MTSKKFWTAVLLLFVAFSLVEVVVKHVRLHQAARAGGDKAENPQNAGIAGPNEQNSTKELSEGVVVYYFHGRERCENCRNIEAYAKEAVQTGFGERLADGSMAWKVVNFDLPANAHFDKDYELGGIPSVVLVKYRDGARIEWKNLTDVWEHVAGGDKAKFLDYVQKELRDFMAKK
ncbi:MAG: hypothetical protein IT426_18000 [Pirellulales bacterium]|nr:hypothetical protein [Pirellulales bacterium]